MNQKIIIYQIFTRLFGNRNITCNENGTLAENGCGKMHDFDNATLKRIKDMGVTHIWYTGLIRHATTTDYTSFGIPINNPIVVKGNAGSPYAITDYYDIDPDLAVDVNNRMKELDKTKPIIVCCARGSRSAMAKRTFLSNGFENVHNVGTWRSLKKF